VKIAFLIVAVALLTFLIILVLTIFEKKIYNMIIDIMEKNPDSIILPYDTKDKFGTLQIYPTKPNGREWFVNMENPLEDNIFQPGMKLTKQNDDAWRVNGTIKSGPQIPKIRMDVTTPNTFEYWKNVEISGYVRVVSYNNTDDTLVWYARGIQHTDKFPCQGTSLKSRLSVDGIVSWKKEIWHTGGYTDGKGKSTIGQSIFNKWVGWKVVIYNIKNETAVKMESYVDINNNNDWIKVSDVLDDGGWYAKTSNELFYSVNCGKPKDYVVINSGPIVAFRSDNLIWDFKNLSVREILPPVN